MQLAETGASRISGPVSGGGGIQQPANQVYEGDTDASWNGAQRGDAARPMPATQEGALSSPVSSPAYDELSGWTSFQPPAPEQLLTPDRLLLPVPEQASVDRIADKTANLLQQVSKRGIYWIASLFTSDE